MPKFLFVADKQHRRKTIWVSRRRFRHWVTLDNDPELVDFRLCCQVAQDDGRVGVVFVPLDILQCDQLEIGSWGSSHRESDIFAAWRAMYLLDRLKTTPKDVLGPDHLMSAYAAGTRHFGQTKLPGMISRQSQLIINMVGGEFHQQVMERTVNNITHVIGPVIRGINAWLSRESFYREFDAGFLSLEDLAGCDPYLTESAKRHKSEAFTLQMFEPEDLAEVAASHGIAAEKRLREETEPLT